MAQPSRRWFSSLLFTPLVVSSLAFLLLPAQAQHNPVEYDENGQLVPATLPHMYRYAFRVQNAMERFATRAASQGRDSSVRYVLRYELGLDNADFGLFEDTAIRFGAADKDIRHQIVAARKADWATHPRTWALSAKAVGVVDGLLAQNENELQTQVGILRGSLSAKSTAALDKRVARFYAKTMMVGQGAQPKSTVTPSSKSNAEPLSESGNAASALALVTSCPTCPLPSVSQGYITFEPDGSTVDAEFDASVSQTSADSGCVITGQFAINQNGSPVATQDEDGSDGATVDVELSAPVSVGSTYSPSAYVSACNTNLGCAGPVFFTGTAFQTGPPAITGTTQSSISIGTAGSFTLSGTDLGGPPGNTPTIAVTTGTGLDLQAYEPTAYNGSSNLAVGTQVVEFDADPNASIGTDTYTLSTVWGSTTGSISVICQLPSIFNISPTPWTTGTKYNITIGGYGFCPGTTVKVTVSTGTVTVTSPVIVNDETITATVQPTNTTNETATVTVTNSAGSGTYKVTIQSANVGPIYLIDPYLLSGYSSGTISTGTVLGALPGNASFAQGLVNDGTSTAIVALQVPSSTTSTTFSVSTGSVAAYATTFLTKAPTTGQTSITVSTPVASGSNYYALALVQAPATPTASSITVTGKTSSGSATGTLTLIAPFVVLAHGLWSNNSAFQYIQNYLTSSGYPANMVLSVCYATTIPWNATGSSGANCTWNSVTAIGKALTDSTTGAYAQYDNMHIAGGRVDYVGHSMGGLAARFYGAQSSYLTNVRDRYQGAIHTFITLDTPAQGSALATFLINNAQCTVQKNKFYKLEKFILHKLGCTDTMTVQQCFYAAGMPLAASGAGATTGAVYSLEPSYIQPLTYPGKPPNSTWVALVAQFPDSASPASLLRTALEEVLANFYGTTNQPAGAPCNTTAAPPTLTSVLGGTANDVIVTTASQSAGFSTSPNSTDNLIGNLEHTKTVDASEVMLELVGYSDTNVLNDVGVESSILAWLKTY
jgi:hypothetical protein